MASLATLGLEVYTRIPSYRDRCPLCRGPGCAVRHGLYYRQVTDRDGAFYPRFPIPRFRCRRRGPRAPEATTFSVLPATLVSRRRLSLDLMLWILELLLEARTSIRAILDTLGHLVEEEAERAWFPEPSTIYRIVRLFLAVEDRLRQQPLATLQLPAPHLPRRRRLRALVARLSRPPRAAPLALGFHRRYFPRLLFLASP